MTRSCATRTFLTTLSKALAPGAKKTVRKRRGRGEGAIYEVKGRKEWCASASFGIDPETGKRLRRTIYARSKKEAEQRLADLRARTGAELARKRAPTLREFVDGWLEREVKPNRRAETYRSYASIAKRHVLPVLGSMRVNVIAPADVARVLGVITERTGANMAGKARTLMHRIFRRAVALELAVRNPASAVEAPRAAKREMQFFTAEQLAQLFKAAKVKRDRFEALAVLLATAGLRIGEALALTWADVELNARTVRVTKQAQEAPGAAKIVEPKTAAARRTVALSAIATVALRRRLRVAEREGYAKPGDLVFPTSVGTVPLKTNLHKQWWRPLLEAAELPRIRLHDLRHSSATLSLAAGTNAKVVADRLGHTNPAFTMRQYQHAIEELHRADATAIDSLIRRQAARVARKARKPRLAIS
jgi:integrase